MDKELSHEIKIKEKTGKKEKKQNKSDNSFLLFYTFNGIKSHWMNTRTNKNMSGPVVKMAMW